MRKSRIFSIVVICLTTLFILVNRMSPKWADALTTHTFVQKDASRLELEWVQTVFNPAFAARQLAATDGKVFFVGSLSQNGNYALIAFESEGGHKLWQVPRANTVDVSSEMVYVNNGGAVVAYTLTGERVWRTTLSVRNISDFNWVDGILDVNAGGDFYLLDAVTGELLNSSTDFNHNLAAYQWLMPTILDGRVFVQDLGMDFSAALALDRQSGDVLWRSADNVISNVAATESLAFVITYEDELRILDARTGKPLETIQIEPSINFFDREAQKYKRIYQLAVDQTNQILYVYLGDSNQLFAFKINR